MKRLAHALAIACVFAARLSAFEVVWQTPQPPLPEAEARVETISSSALRQLAQVDSLLEAQAWDEAVDAVLELIDQSDGNLVAVTGDHYLPLAAACQLRITRWPAEALAAYRGRVDTLAAAEFERAMRERSESGLQRIADIYFSSSSGDDALAALGEIALERGDYNSARGYWRRISPALAAPDGRPWGVALAGVDLSVAEVWEKIFAQVAVSQALPTQLSYPDSDISLAEVMARLAIVSIRERSFARAEVESELLKRLYPDAVGAIGGREAPLSQAVADTLASARQWPAPKAPTDWPTYAGTNRRGVVAAPVGDTSRVAWSHSLAPAAAPPDPEIHVQSWLERRRRLQSGEASVLVEPLISGNAVVFHDGEILRALKLATGTPLFGERGEVYRESSLWPNADERLLQRQNAVRDNVVIRRQIQVRGGQPAIRVQAIEGPIILRGVGIRGGVMQFGGPLPGLRNSLQTEEAKQLVALEGSLVYATLGLREGDPRANTNVPPAERLLMLDLDAEGKLRLEIEPDADCKFSGPAVVAGDHVYLPMREGEGAARLVVACYTKSTGRQLWRTAVCSFVNPPPASDILTLGEGQLYINTCAGVVAAVRTTDGGFAWARTYTRAMSSFPNDLSEVESRPAGPCLVTDGAVVCAPPDAPAIFALDPATGRTLWTNEEAFDVTDLLGVVDGRLIASGKRLWMIDVLSGKSLAAWPDTRSAGIAGAGRGAVAGDEVFWPTKGAIRVFSATTGQQTRQPIPLQELGGDRANVVPTDKQLLVITPSRISLLTSGPPATTPAESIPPVEL